MKSALQTPNSELRTAFTLVELLIAVSIIILLTAIGVGVGYRFMTAADTEQTRADMTLIMNAIEDYFDQKGEYPEQENSPATVLKDYRLRIPHIDTNGDIEPIFERFSSRISKVSENIFDDKDSSTDYEPFEDAPGPSAKPRDALFNLYDADGNRILYLRNGALGGRPLLIAPGADGKYRMEGTTPAQKDEYGEDDIRSDK